MWRGRPIRMGWCRRTFRWMSCTRMTFSSPLTSPTAWSSTLPRVTGRALWSTPSHSATARSSTCSTPTTSAWPTPTRTTPTPTPTTRSPRSPPPPSAPSAQASSTASTRAPLVSSSSRESPPRAAASSSSFPRAQSQKPTSPSASVIQLAADLPTQSSTRPLAATRAAGSVWRLCLKVGPARQQGARRGVRYRLWRWKVTAIFA
mmetsp:Transcript_48417/g.118522  ORF Transcript_48417/g.118522 Transcript_48417/m.118522 type:complete len:204 (+) Transcript_48417:48-659(+)